MTTKFLKFSNQEKLSRKQLTIIYGGSIDDDDHTGPKVLKPDRPTSPAGGGN